MKAFLCFTNLLDNILDCSNVLYNMASSTYIVSSTGKNNFILFDKSISSLLSIKSINFIKSLIIIIIYYKQIYYYINFFI